MSLKVSNRVVEHLNIFGTDRTDPNESFCSTGFLNLEKTMGTDCIYFQGNAIPEGKLNELFGKALFCWKTNFPDWVKNTSKILNTITRFLKVHTPI